MTLILTLMIFTASLTIIWMGPKIQVKRINLRKIDKIQVIDLENKIRQTYSQIIGGLVVIVGFYISYSNFVSIKFKQNTEILSNCLSQLSDSSQSIRIGSIYTLSKLANDSKEDRKIVLDILCDFLSNDSTGLRSNKEITIALKTIVNTFKEISSEDDSLFIYNSLFRKLNIPNLNLSAVSFIQCRFKNCIIFSSSFESSDLSDSEFNQCIMSDINFSNSIAFNTRYLSCNLSRSNFSYARLNSAIFSDCSLNEVDFNHASFGTSYTPKHIGSFNNFLNDVTNYGKTKIEKSNITDVISLDRDTTRILLINNQE